MIRKPRAKIRLGTSLNRIPSLTNVPSIAEVVLNEPSKESLNVPLSNDYQERLLYLTKKIEQCKDECNQLQQEKRGLDDFMVKREIEGITLSTDKKLIDFLIERILDPSKEWKQKIDRLIHIPNSIKGDILRGGDYFEALFQLAIAIGILPMFMNRFVRFYDVDKYNKMVTKDNYLYNKTIKNSGVYEQGISDITFEISSNETFEETVSKSYTCGEIPKQQRTQNPFYFISVKGYKREKSIKDEYDIPLLDQQARIFPDLNRHIIVCVRNKPQFLTHLSRTKMDFLKHSIDYVIGYDEVMDAFEQFRMNFFRRVRDPSHIEREVRTLFPPDVLYKPSMNLYFHQELVVQSVIQRIQEIKHDKPHFLCIGVLPRGGKSFIAGGIIDAHKKKGYNVLFLTSAVTETIEQFREDLIEKYSDFSDFQFVDVRNPQKETKPNKFYFMSRQLAGQDTDIDLTKDMFATLEKKLGSIPELDIIFFDEAHIGITDTTRANFQKAFERFKMPVILMTATYKKPSLLLESTKDLFVWDLQDIKEMKRLPILGLEEFKNTKPDVLTRYSNALDLLTYRIGMGETMDQLCKPYQNFPNPNFISLTFAPDTIQHLLDTGTGFDMQKVFQLNVDHAILSVPSRMTEWSSMIAQRDYAIRFRQFMTPEQENEEFPFLQNKERKYRALNQIFSITQKNGSRPVQGKPFSILMFLPFAKKGRGESGIGELCRVWGAFMLESKYWRENFVFLTLSTYNHPSYKKDPTITLQHAVKKGLCHREDHSKYGLKELILEVEQEALRQGKGLVLLTGDVAKMGISLKCIDVIFLMSDHADADDIIQKMYRALTDDPPYKKDGFIVDMDIKRVIKAMFDYELEKDKIRHTLALPTVSERLQKVWELCNWGQDSFMEDHPEMDLSDIMDVIKRRVLIDVETRILDEFNDTYKKIEDTQLVLLRQDAVLYGEMTTMLQNTTSKTKSKRTKAETITERGKEIPVEVDLNANEPEKPKQALLTAEQIEKKMGSIIKTFVNALVIKSSEPWNQSLNLVSLLEKYKRDEESADVVSCDCQDTDDCKKEHTNLYEAVFCELHNYAIHSIEGKKEEYDETLHKEIMTLVQKVFETTTLFVEWNMYIETLLQEIHLINTEKYSPPPIKTRRKTGPTRTLKSKK